MQGALALVRRAVPFGCTAASEVQGMHSQTMGTDTKPGQEGNDCDPPGVIVYSGVCSNDCIADWPRYAPPPDPACGRLCLWGPAPGREDCAAAG